MDCLLDKNQINPQTRKFLINMPFQLLNYIAKCNPPDVCRSNTP